MSQAAPVMYAPDQGVRDVVGVGFGPANLALAIAATERQEVLGAAPLRAEFLERQDSFGWHSGMLLQDATMQVSFLKDLATLRNPRSRFGFLSYLHDRGRLVDFINHKEFFPSRVEFHDYLCWAADRFTEFVRYGAEVRSVVPVSEGSEVVAFDVEACDGAAGETTTTLRTRNVVIASGLVPRMPPGVVESSRVWHSSRLLHRIEAFDAGPSPVFVVVGAGQSAAEVTAHLHERFPAAQVLSVISRYGYTPADDSPFANRVFDPGAVDDFFGSPPATKDRFYRYHANTNYSVVDLDLINELYRRHYQELVRDERRLHLLTMSRVTDVEPHADGVDVVIESLASGGKRQVRAAATVFATGYDAMDPTTVLGPAAELCKRDTAGRLRVGRDYRVETAAGVSAGIYLQGGTEHTHGITGSLLSAVSTRAWDIVESITGRA